MRFRSRFRFRSRNDKIALIRQLRSISRLSRRENADRATPKPFQCGRFGAVRPHFESMVTNDLIKKDLWKWLKPERVELGGSQQFQRGVSGMSKEREGSSSKNEENRKKSRTIRRSRGGLNP